jgi:magnesium transporter
VTIIDRLYGMNFDIMPELHWRFGYPMALGMMVLAGFVMWVIFKRKNWL